mgnify:CR=1 FL=1
MLCDAKDTNEADTRSAQAQANVERRGATRQTILVTSVAQGKARIPEAQPNVQGVRALCVCGGSRQPGAIGR